MRKTLFLLGILSFALAGCAINTRYVSYTDQKLPPKSQYYFVSIYPEGKPLPFTQAYQTIGRVEVSGSASENVSVDLFMDKARNIARAKGADAIINVRTEHIEAGGMDVIPGHCRHHYCYPDEYVPYTYTVLRFRGELISF